MTALEERARRLKLIEQWVTFAFNTGDEELASELTQIVRYTIDGFMMTRSESVVDLQWMRDQVRAALVALVDDDHSWSLPKSYLTEITLHVVKGATGTAYSWEGSVNGIFLKALEIILLDPQIDRVVRCSEPGCEAVFVRHKGGIYCKQHGTNAYRIRRYTEGLSDEVKVKRNRDYYLRRIRRTDPAHYHHLIAIEQEERLSNGCQITL